TGGSFLPVGSPHYLRRNQSPTPSSVFARPSTRSVSACHMTSIAVIFRRKRFFRPAEDTTHREELSCSSAEPVGRPQREAGAQIGLGGGRLRRGLAQPRCLQGGDDLGDQADAEFELFVGGRS